MAVPQFPPPRVRRSRAVVVVLAALVVLAAVLGGHRAPVAAATTTTTTTGVTTTTAPPSSNTGPVPAYWLVAGDGGVFSFGGMPFYGSMGGTHLNAPMVGMASTADGKGYWTAASDGGVFSFGDAAFHGSMGGTKLNQPVVGMADDSVTGGYWLVASDGGIFSFDAPFYGSTGGTVLNKPVVGMAPTPDGRGYWLFASDGGVFTFGDASFHGSMGGTKLDAPVVGAAAPDAGGYWMVASDGGIFSFGDAAFHGSLGGQALSRPIVGLAAADPGGYWTTDTNGAVTAFGDGSYWGSAPQQLNAPVVGMADGPGTDQASGNGIYPSGSYGYDVSVFNDNPPTCNSTLPSGHTIGIVQATGWPGSAQNPCLVHEAQWAGAGLDLYTFLAYGTSSTNEPGCQRSDGSYDQACNFGYQAAAYAFDYVKTSAVNPYVTWWLDVEDANDYWSSNTAENAQVVQGALDELRDQGVNNVGIYTNPDGWNPIVGDYQPAVPVWIAWYTGSGPGNCQNIASYASSHGDMLPTGPTWVTQYSSDAATQSNGQPVDGDYAC